MKLHTELLPSYVGTGGTVGGAITGFCLAVEPILQVLVLLVTAIVGILTAVWTWKKIKGHSKED